LKLERSVLSINTLQSGWCILSQPLQVSFSLPADAPCSAERLPQDQMLRLSPFGKQKTDQASPFGAGHQSLQDQQGKAEEHLPGMRGGNEDRQDNNPGILANGPLFTLIGTGGIIMRPEPGIGPLPKNRRLRQWSGASGRRPVLPLCTPFSRKIPLQRAVFRYPTK
jgi:hypothetical protein